MLNCQESDKEDEAGYFSQAVTGDAMAKSWVDCLSELCEPADKARFSIELDNGLKVSGVGDFETLRLLFRDPDNLTCVVSADVSSDCKLPVSIVLPPGIVGPWKCDIVKE